jgi:hypothetical protein
MEKSPAYDIPGHIDAHALFFKVNEKDIHSALRRIWTQAFSGRG